jgi:hypothetical protein
VYQRLTYNFWPLESQRILPVNHLQPAAACEYCILIWIKALLNIHVYHFRMPPHGGLILVRNAFPV